MNQNSNNWTEIIRSKSSSFRLNLKELIEYKDLLLMFVKRDFAATYKQTILGPIWFFIQPILTTLMFTIVFGKFANLKTDVEPKFLFYFSGIVIWNYFSDCFIKTSTVFKDNAQLFGKVFFPRLVMPLSIILSNLLKFSIQFLLFVILVVYYHFQNKSQVNPTIAIVLTPLYLLLMAGLAFGAGLVIAALTTKYRDLSFLISFGVQLLMYASPIIYSSTTINQKFKSYIQLNPLTGIIESFRNSYLGTGEVEIFSLLYSFLCMLIFIILGLFFFNKVEQKFIDTV
jgi:lipopolysaccharide transport system permease protein